MIFFKSTTALEGPDDVVVIPKGASKVDWEVELAVVVGAARLTYRWLARSITSRDTFCTTTTRNAAFNSNAAGSGSKARAPTPLPRLGPYVATRDEISDAQQLGMWLSVNGEVVQKSTTANMIFDVPTLVSYVSEFMTLLPGDVISTGTPAGVGLGMKPEPRYLQPGDIVELGIDGLGTQRQRVISYSERETRR